MKIALIENNVVMKIIMVKDESAANTFYGDSWIEANAFTCKGDKLVNGLLPEPAPVIEPPSYLSLRQNAIMQKWPVHAQFEAHCEAAEEPPRREKLDALLADIQAIKNEFPAE